jgi:5-methylthioadenosine/S-adenosylhomocysteine deaminase
MIAWCLQLIKLERSKTVKLIKNARIITMDPQRRTFDQGAIAIKGSRIVAVGESATLEKEYRDAEIIDAKGMLVIPGLINAHTHLYQILYKGLGDDASLSNWLKKCVYPMSLVLRGKDCYDATMLTAVEMIKGGSTTYVDCHYMNRDLECQDYIAEATKVSGLRGVMGRGTIDSAPAPEELRESIPQAVAECERVIKTYHGTLDGRLSVRVEALNEKLASTEMLRAMRGVANDFGVGINMHIAEASERVKETQERFGMTSIEYAHSLGILGPDALLAHCCWLSEHDKQLLADTHTSVAHNPVSNQYLSDGVAPIPELTKMGVNVTAGPDGACSNNNQNMFDVMKSAALLHKVHYLDPEIMTAAMVFEMVTINAAKAIGMEKDLGSLEVGKYADLAIIDLEQPCMIPCFNPLSNLVYSATPDVVNSTMIHGEMLMRDRELLHIDEKETLAKASATSWDLARRAGLA